MRNDFVDLDITTLFLKFLNYIRWDWLQIMQK